MAFRCGHNLTSGSVERFYARRSFAAFLKPDAVVRRKIWKLLHESAGPEDGGGDGTARLTEAEEQFFAVLREESGSGLHRTRVNSLFCFDRHDGANCIAIAFCGR